MTARMKGAYAHWVRRCVRFHRRRHPRDLGVEPVRDFLTHLARAEAVSASTQNQALAALLFLYREVLGLPIARSMAHLHAKRPERLPVVLTRDETQQVLRAMLGTTRLMASLMYGSGMRVMECCTLRLKDVDLSRGEIVIRSGKGPRDRVTMLPQRILPTLRGVDCGARGADREAGDESFLPAQLLDAPAGIGVGHSHHPGIAGAQRRADDDDVHARAEPGRAGGTESVGFVTAK